jgi:hypothetical protein
MTVLLFGIALIVLPGPAFVVIPIGLAILATEFAWARRWLKILRESAEKGVDQLESFPVVGGWVSKIKVFITGIAAKFGFKPKEKSPQSPRDTEII